MASQRLSKLPAGGMVVGLVKAEGSEAIDAVAVVAEVVLTGVSGADAGADPPLAVGGVPVLAERTMGWTWAGEAGGACGAAAGAVAAGEGCAFWPPAAGGLTLAAVAASARPVLAPEYSVENSPGPAPGRPEDDGEAAAVASARGGRADASEVSWGGLGAFTLFGSDTGRLNVVAVRNGFPAAVDTAFGS